ncbi:MAG: TonB-dependent receptor [Hyphomonadaceae bacterium]|nr:TonB-dependent receptor [Hyphomonadaceae bacterium]
MKNWFKKNDRLLAGTILAGASVVGLVAPAAAQDAGVGDEIVVTGSRIPQANLQSVSPIQVVNDEEFKLQGTFEASNIINTLPQNFQTPGVDFSNTPNPLSTPGGLTTANLRGLGPQRTLVLVDGVRLGVGDVHSGNPNPGPNLDQIPGALVRRVEVVTGGASAAYGSDAVAGVINFIMMDNFEGLKVDAQYGFAQHKNDNEYIQGIVRGNGLPVPEEDVSGGENGDFNIVVGSNLADGRGNVTGYMGYHRQSPVTQAERDFSGCLLASIGTDFICANSSNSNSFTSLDTGNRFSQVGTQFLPWPNATSNPPPTFNSSPFQFLSRDDTRYSAGYFAHYDVNDHFSFYSQLNLMHDRSTLNVGPSALFQQNGVVSVNCDNPLLSAQQQTVLGCTDTSIIPDTDPLRPGNQGNASLIIGRRSIEGGPREFSFDHTSYRLVAGGRGEIVDGWNYDIYAQYYYTQVEQGYIGDLNKNNMFKALQVVQTAAGPQCKSQVDGTDTLCRPWNIFRDGGVTPEALAYIGTDAQAWGRGQQQVVSANINGDLGTFGIRSPAAEDGVALAVGTEYRREEGYFHADPIWASGALTGTGGALGVTDGSYDVIELFGETRIPIAQDKPFFQNLVVEAGYRFSDYSLAGETETYKLGLQWSPSEDLQFRGSFQHAVRAPNIIDLFAPLGVTNSAVLTTDPCAGPVPTATFEQCARTGVTLAQYNSGSIIPCPAGQCGVEQGGNPNVLPEAADTKSLGITFTPTFISGLVISVDWWDIDLEDVIGVVPANVAFNNCLLNNNPVFCNRITRTPQGFLFGDTIAGGGYIFTPGDNIASGHTAGVDVQASYTLRMGEMGSLSTLFNGSYIDKAAVKSDADTPEYDCAGLYGIVCAITPNWRHTMRVSWDSPWNVMASLQWRYIDGMLLDADSDQPVIGGACCDPIDHRMKSVSYFDLSGIWDINETVSLRAGANNVLDRSPQVSPGLGISGVGGPNAFPTYDLLGRTVFVGLTASF